MDNFQLLNVYRFCVIIQEEIHVQHVLPYDIKLMHISKSAIAHVIKKFRVFFMQYIICFKLSDLVINKSLNMYSQVTILKLIPLLIFSNFCLKKNYFATLLHVTFSHFMQLHVVTVSGSGVKIKHKCYSTIPIETSVLV